MRVVSIILARGGSKGLPNKNILEFAGKPLIYWSIKQSIESEGINDVYVSSDSDEILRISKSFGAKTIKRPNKLSMDTSTSEEALLHAISCIGDVDIIIFLQPTSPLRDNNDIENSLKLFIDGKYDSLFSSIELEDMCIWKKENGVFESFNFDYKNRKRRQETENQYLENGSIYVFKPETLKKFNNRLGGNIGTYIMENWKQYEIDNIHDFTMCEIFFKKKF